MGLELLNDNSYVAPFDQWQKRRSVGIKHVLPLDEYPAVSATALQKREQWVKIHSRDW